MGFNSGFKGLTDTGVKTSEDI